MTAAKTRGERALELLTELWRLRCASLGDAPAHRDIDEMHAAWDAVRELMLEKWSMVDAPDAPAMTPIDAPHAKLAWMVLRSKFDAATHLQFQNSGDVLDLFFGFDPRTRRPR